MSTDYLWGVLICWRVTLRWVESWAGEAVPSYPGGSLWNTGYLRCSLSPPKSPEMTEPPLPILPRCAVPLPAHLPGMQQGWRAQRLLQKGPLLWTVGLCGNINSNNLWQCPKPSLSSLFILPSSFLTQENKAVKSWFHFYSINTLQLPCIHTNTKRWQPNYLPYKFHITQLQSRYEYHFLSETFRPKINIPPSQSNFFFF